MEDWPNFYGLLKIYELYDKEVLNSIVLTVFRISQESRNLIHYRDAGTGGRGGGRIPPTALFGR